LSVNAACRGNLIKSPNCFGFIRAQQRRKFCGGICAYIFRKLLNFMHNAVRRLIGAISQTSFPHAPFRNVGVRSFCEHIRPDRCKRLGIDP